MVRRLCVHCAGSGFTISWATAGVGGSAVESDSGQDGAVLATYESHALPDGLFRLT